MSSPDNKQANLVAPGKPNQTRMVKIKALQPIRLTREGGEKIVAPGQTAEVTEDEAREFCDKKFDIGVRDYFGNSDKKALKNTVVKRAERVA